MSNSLSPFILLLTLISWEVKKKKKGSHTLRLFFTLHWRTYSPGSGNPACSLRNHRRNNWWGGWSDWQLAEGHSTFLPTLPGSLTSLHQSKVRWLPRCLHFITTKKHIPAFYRAQVSGKFSSMSILFNTFFFFKWKQSSLNHATEIFCCQRYFFLNK